MPVLGPWPAHWNYCETIGILRDEDATLLPNPRPRFTPVRHGRPHQKPVCRQHRVQWFMQGPSTFIKVEGPYRENRRVQSHIYIRSEQDWNPLTPCSIAKAECRTYVCRAEVLVELSLFPRRSQSNRPLIRNYTYKFMMSAKLLFLFSNCQFRLQSYIESQRDALFLRFIW